MAIRAPDYIMPDPVGNNLKAFEVADRSARDYARIQLEQQRFAEQAVERAKRAKADDFNSMMEMMKFNNTLEQQKISNTQRDRALDAQEFNAGTSRYRATNPSSSSRDPNDRARAFLGGVALPGSDAPAETTDDGGYIPGGATLPSGDNPGVSEGGPVPILFPGGSPGAEDTDLPMGDNTGQQDLISAQNEPIPTAPIPKAIPVADVVIVVPAAPAAPAKPPVVMTSEQQFDAVAGNYPVPPSSGGSYADGAMGMVNSLSSAAFQQIEREMPSSFSKADVTQDDRNRMLTLWRENAQLKEKVTNARSKASQAAMYKRSVTDPEVARQLSAVQDQASREAEEAAGMAVDAQYRSLELQKQQALNQQRQDKITSLAHMDDVMPSSVRMSILNDVGNPRTAAKADRDIAVLGAYDKVRNIEGLDYKSNGLKTAEKVVSAALSLRSDAGVKDMADYERLQSYRDVIARNSALSEDKQKSAKQLQALEDKMLELEPGADKWEKRERAFKAAVAADRVKEPDPVTPRAADIRVNPAPATTPAAPLPAISTDPAKPMKQSDESWTAIKNQFAQENPEVVERIQQIVNEDPVLRTRAITELLKDPKHPILTKKYAEVDRKVAANRVLGHEVALAIADDMVKSRTGGFTIKRK